MNIFEAEIRKKVLLGEDSLTAKFFGLLELLPPKAALEPFLSRVGIPKKEDRGWRVILWPYFKSREPDVVLEASDLVIIVESKFGSPLGAKQLIDEYEEGRDEYRERAVQLVALTHEVNEPQAMATARAFLEERYGQECVRWISWNDMHPLLRRASRTHGLSKVERKLVQGILELFERYDIRGFDMFTHAYASVGDAIHFVDEFLLFTREVGKKASLLIGEYPWKGDADTYSEDHDLPVLGHFLHPDIRVHFFDNAWGEDCHRCLYLSCPVHEIQPRIRCGYWMAFFNDCRLLHLGLVKENWAGIVEKFGGMEGLKAKFWGPPVDLVLAEEAYDEAEVARHKAIDFEIELWKSEHTEVPQQQLINLATERLIQLKDAVNELRLAKTYAEKKAFLDAMRQAEQALHKAEDQHSE